MEEYGSTLTVTYEKCRICVTVKILINRRRFIKKSKEQKAVGKCQATAWQRVVLQQHQRYQRRFGNTERIRDARAYRSSG